MLFMKMYLGGGLASSSQTVGSILIPPADFAGWKNDLGIASMDSTNIKI
jgi:hypothetical protein